MLEEAFDVVLENREGGSMGRTENGLVLLFEDEDDPLTRSVHATDGEEGLVIEYTVWRERNGTRYWTRQQFVTLHDTKANVVTDLLELAIGEVNNITEAELTNSESVRQTA